MKRISEQETVFNFTDPGWDPTWLKWGTYRKRVTQRFERELANYETRLRALSEERGLVKAQARYSLLNIEWFALYQLGGLSSVAILKRYDSITGDESTILKGVDAAAALLGWSSLR